MSTQKSLTAKVHHKPPKKLKLHKRAERIAEYETFGRLKGEERFKNTKKGWKRSLRDHVGKAIDRIDPLELIAMAGGTYVIHDIIKNSPQYSSKALSMVIQFNPITTFATPFVKAVFSQTLEKVEFPDRLEFWLVAFFISYLIVKHGGQLLGLMKDGAGSIASIVGACLV